MCYHKETFIIVLTFRLLGTILRKSIFIHAGVFVISACSLGQAAAQQPNPLVNLLGTLQKIAAGPTAQPREVPVSSPGAAVGQSASTDDILQSLGANYRYSANPSSCKFYYDQANQIDLAQRTGRFMDAATRAKLQASQEAACALGNYGPPLAQAKTQVGSFLALAAINYHRAGMVTDETLVDARQAITLLKVDEGSNAALIAKLEDLFWPKGPVADTKAFATMTGLEAATKYQQNTFAFERTFSGKTLQIKGRVLGISGSEKSASIRLEGVKRDVDHRSWRDTIDCEVKDKTAMDAAAQISEGDTVSVQGVVRKGPMPGVSLGDCRLIR